MNEKIITCAPLPPPHGGITNWYQILMREADKSGVEFVNVDTSPKTAGNKRSMFNRIVVQGVGMLSKRRQLKKALRRHKDIACAHLATSAQFGLVRDIAFMRLLKKNGIPAVYHLHFGRVPDILASGGTECRLMKTAVSLADTVIAIDRRTEEALTAHFPDTQIEYIPNPIELTETPSRDVPPKKTILYLGMVYKEKGIEELLTAWGILKNDHPEWTLTIAGACDDDYKAYLESRFDLGRVTMTGFLSHDDAMAVLDESAFLVLPSYTEGFPNVVIEAMMHKKAVIATSVGAVEDILAGDCGIVIPPKDVPALSQALECLMQNAAARDAMGARGREKVQTQYAADLVFAQYRQIWKRVSENRS